MTHRVECVPVSVSSWDGHSYYGILGYSDTQGRVLCQSQYNPRMVTYSYYGILGPGYSDTQGRVCASPSIIPGWQQLLQHTGILSHTGQSVCQSQCYPGMVTVTMAYWDTLTHRVECVPVPVSSQDGRVQLQQATGIL